MALDFRTYPPKGHQGRSAAYQRFEKLFLGQHKDLYLTSPGRYQMVRYIVANFAGLISRLAADLLFGEQPDFVSADEDQAGQEALTRIVIANHLHATNYESALSNSFRGDAVCKARRGRRLRRTLLPAEARPLRHCHTAVD